MVNKLFLLVLALYLLSCRQNAVGVVNEVSVSCIDTSSNFPYWLYDSKANMPDSLRNSRWKTIPLEWYSLPPVDSVRVGIHEGDTIVKIVTCETAEEFISIGHLNLSLDVFKSIPTFSRFPHIAIDVQPPPSLFSVKSLLILEGTLPRGWEYGDPEPFYIVTNR